MFSRFAARTRTQLFRHNTRTLVQSKDFLKHKDKLTVDPKKIHTIDPLCTVQEAATQLTKFNISCLIVAKGNEVVGLMTERDVIKCMGRHGENFDLKIRVTAIMTKQEDIFSFKYTEKTLKGVLTEMERLNIRHIPTTKKNEIIGIISMRDVNEKVVELLKQENSEMRFYFAF